MLRPNVSLVDHCHKPDSAQPLLPTSCRAPCFWFLSVCSLPTPRLPPSTELGTRSLPLQLLHEASYLHGSNLRLGCSKVYGAYATSVAIKLNTEAPRGRASNPTWTLGGLLHG
ncbi:hypothetical protein VNO77_33887 [Canavalia gladiata]|uniref:Uncharacterized protein n=1 Tax=Canavalia gladiata TaxID=3824 RepID=A0AAN9KEM8_CANGL